MKTTTIQSLDFAKTDLRSCENNLTDECVTNIVAFHAQQAVEKAFKALLSEKGIPVPRVHNLIRLHSFSEQYLIEPINFLELDALDDVYTSSRYPSDFGLIASGKPSLSESIGLFESAEKIFHIIFRSIE